MFIFQSYFRMFWYSHVIRNCLRTSFIFQTRFIANSNVNLNVRVWTRCFVYLHSNVNCNSNGWWLWRIYLDIHNTQVCIYTIWYCSINVLHCDCIRAIMVRICMQTGRRDHCRRARERQTTAKTLYVCNWTKELFSCTTR